MSSIVNCPALAKIRLERGTQALSTPNAIALLPK
jgi:hypothetical protein